MCLFFVWNLGLNSQNLVACLNINLENFAECSRCMRFLPKIDYDYRLFRFSRDLMRGYVSREIWAHRIRKGY